VRKLQLTELFVKKARPENAAYLVWDSKQHGIALQVQPTGSRAWKAIYSYHGRPRWLHLGSANAIALSDARTLAAEAMLAVARGRDPAAERKAERGGGTFAELAERYVEVYAKRNNKSWEQAQRLVSRYVIPRWGKLQASTIARADVKSMLARIQAPILANQILAAVSAIFSWAVREEVLPSNPCKLSNAMKPQAGSVCCRKRSFPASGRPLVRPGCRAQRSKQSCCWANVPVKWPT
jgi:hypothetical protein